jgi:diaminopimelate decarboxylase
LAASRRTSPRTRSSARSSGRSSSASWRPSSACSIGDAASSDVDDPIARLGPTLRAAARRYGTPLYVTDQASLESAAREVERAFPDPWLRAYSLKANDVAGIVARIAALGWDANVVSLGEWAIARRAGLPNGRITLEGIGKGDAELAAAVASARQGSPLRWIAVESLDEALALAEIARQHGSGPALDVLLRLNPEVVPETLGGLAVGSAASKFGMTVDELSQAVAIIEASPGLRPRGIQLHVGSQLRAVDGWRDGVRRGLALLALLGGTRETFDTLDVGGGFPVVAAGDAAPAPARFARELPALLSAIPPDRRPRRLAIEPGRVLVARAGFLVARVLHVRDRGGRQVVVDAGMTELIRPALYGARHDVAALTSLGRPIDGPAATLEPARLEGPICESTDHLGEHLLPPLRRGDLVAIRDAGAYAASLSSAYNGRTRPPQVIVEADGSLTLVRRRGAAAALG